MITSLNIKLDNNLKQQFIAFSNNLGLSSSDAMTYCIKKVIQPEKVASKQSTKEKDKKNYLIDDNTSMLVLEIDNDLKIKFLNFCKELELTPSQVLRIIIKNAITKKPKLTKAQLKEHKRRYLNTLAWMRDGQKIYAGIAEKLGLKDEYDVARWLKETRDEQ